MPALMSDMLQLVDCWPNWAADLHRKPRIRTRAEPFLSLKAVKQLIGRTLCRSRCGCDRAL